MDIERAVISKVMQTKDITTALERKITEEFFSTDEHKNAWRRILSYWTDYGEVPPVRVLRSSYPHYSLMKVDEPFDFVLGELVEQRKKTLLGEMLVDTSMELQSDNPDQALNVVASYLTQVNTEVSSLREEDIMYNAATRYEHYQWLEEQEDVMRGIPTGFPTIDKATNGLQPEQLVTVVGLPKAGKSIVLLRIAKAVHDAGKIPLFIGFEMSNYEQTLRFDAMAAEVSYNRLTTGKLKSSEQRRLGQTLKKMEEKHPFILSSDISSATTVSGVSAKIEQERPDVVFIDGVYLMDDEQDQTTDKGSAKALTNITRSLKRVAQKHQVPIVITTQVLSWKKKKDGITQDAIGYSSSFAQDSDVILGVEAGEEDSAELVLRIVEARNCPRDETIILMDWDAGRFEEYGSQTAKEQSETVSSGPTL